jgi:hypothetical protein
MKPHYDESVRSGRLSARLPSRHVARVAQNLRAFVRGYRFASDLPEQEGSIQRVPPAASPSRLQTYYDQHLAGPGIWKFRHYFPIYERHFAKFVDKEVHVVEIGVYSGGSLLMWRDYFGERAMVYGVDIEPACRAYEQTGIRIFIGDQADPDFWASFRDQVPTVDIVIDDGGHQPRQQIATLEALLPHVRPGGVYVCEDVYRPLSPFYAYVDGLTRPVTNTSGRPAGTQQHIASVHRYSHVVVIEKPHLPVPPFDAPRRGTEWQPWSA